MPLEAFEKLLTGLDIYYISVLTKNPNVISIDIASRIEYEYDKFKMVKVGEFVKPGSFETIFVVGLVIKDIDKKDDAIKSFINLILDKDSDAIIFIHQNTYYNMPLSLSKLLRNSELKYWEH